MHGFSVIAVLLCVPLLAVACTGNAAPDDVRLSTDSSGVDWQDTIDVAMGEAYQGPWRMNESDFRYVDAPTVALSVDGTAAVVWVDQAEQDIYFQRYGPDGDTQLTGPVNVSRSPDIFSWLPRVLVSDDASEVFVLWQEIIFSGGSHGGEILFARSTDGGETFSEPVNLSNSEHGAGKGRLTWNRWDNGSLDLASGPNGELYAAWTEYEGTLWFSRSTDRGETFSDPLAVFEGSDIEPARAPSLAVGPEKELYLAWTVGEQADADIHLARSDDGGESFSEPSVVHESSGHSDAPKIAADGQGILHLVYGESPGGPLERYHIQYARSINGGDSFDEPREIAGGDDNRYESMNYPAVRVDGEGNVFVVWELFPSFRERPQGLALATSRDGGDTFDERAVVPGTVDPSLGFNGSLQGMLMQKLAVGAGGRIAVVNGTFLPGEESRIRLIRGALAEVDGRREDAL